LVAPRVVSLGSIVETGNEEIYTRASHPYTQALLSSVPVPDPDVRRERIRLTGDVPSPADPPSGCRFRTRCPKAQDVCAEEPPALEVRASTDHPTACHFAEPPHLVRAE
jgi:oligopeptide transport system ATP-binding protein